MKRTAFLVVSDEAAARIWQRHLLVSFALCGGLNALVLTVVAGVFSPGIFAETNKIWLWILVCISLVGGSIGLGLMSSRRLISKVMNRMHSTRNFLQDAGHELATPVTMIRSRLQVMEAEFESDPRISEHIDILSETIIRLVVLIEDIRTLARAEAPRVMSNLSLINLGSLTRICGAQIKSLSEAKQINLNIDVHKSATIIGDYDGIARVISNLLSNSVRYGKTGGNINVKVEPKSQTVVLIVEDDGIGISPEALPKIFDRFYRAQSNPVEQESSSGLGLAIVKAIVESHSGKIHVESQPGQFTRFIVELPKTPVHPLARLMKARY